MTEIIGRQNIVEKLLNYFNAAQHSGQEKQEQHLLPAGAKFNSFSIRVKVTGKKGCTKNRSLRSLSQIQENFFIPLKFDLGLIAFFTVSHCKN